MLAGCCQMNFDTAVHFSTEMGGQEAGILRSANRQYLFIREQTVVDQQSTDDTAQQLEPVASTSRSLPEPSAKVRHMD